MSRTIVITGASSGIGAELARQLAARGDAVVLAARREAALVAVAAECGTNALAVRTDVTSRADVERLRDEAIARFGQIDVWVNNAGQGIHKHVLDLTDDDVSAMVDSNLRSVLYGVQTIVPHFRERGAGQIVNVSSMLARLPVAPVRSIYSAAKAAVNSISSSLRIDLSDAPGIHVTVVMPGIVATDFPTRVLGDAEPPWTPGQQVGPQRVQTVEEVARMIVGVIDHPVAELYTNPAATGLVARYYADVGAFEAGIGAPPAAGDR